VSREELKWGDKSSQHAAFGREVSGIKFGRLYCVHEPLWDLVTLGGTSVTNLLGGLMVTASPRLFNHL